MDVPIKNIYIGPPLLNGEGGKMDTTDNFKTMKERMRRRITVTSSLTKIYIDRLHIGMDRNFVCLWRRRNCKSQVIDLSLFALISGLMKSIIGFLNNSNLHAIISTLLVNNIH